MRISTMEWQKVRGEGRLGGQRPRRSRFNAVRGKNRSLHDVGLGRGKRRKRRGRRGVDGAENFGGEAAYEIGQAEGAMLERASAHPGAKHSSAKRARPGGSRCSGPSVNSVDSMAPLFPRR